MYKYLSVFGGPIVMQIYLSMLPPTELSAQANTHSLRFFGTGTNQQDRARFAIDNNVPGANTTSAADIGAGDFTIELWVKGTRSPGVNNTTARAAGSYGDYDWIQGNIVMDRDIDGPSQRDWGVSLRGGRVEFGTGAGDAGGTNNTLVGAVDVLDGQWRHIALVRQGTTKRIYIGGVLDRQATAPNAPDVSFPDSGTAQQTHCPPLNVYGHFIVLAAEKHDYDQFEEPGCATPAFFEYPSFNGHLDEVRLWNVARSAADIADQRDDVIDAASPGLVAYWRFEEGTGTVLDDRVTGNPDGTLIAGVAGNGQWSTDAPPLVAPTPMTRDHLRVE